MCRALAPRGACTDTWGSPPFVRPLVADLLHLSRHSRSTRCATVVSRRARPPHSPVHAPSHPSPNVHTNHPDLVCLSSPLQHPTKTLGTAFQRLVTGVLLFSYRVPQMHSSATWTSIRRPDPHGRPAAASPAVAGTEILCQPFLSSTLMLAARCRSLPSRGFSRSCHPTLLDSLSFPQSKEKGIRKHRRRGWSFAHPG